MSRLNLFFTTAFYNNLFVGVTCGQSRHRASRSAIVDLAWRRVFTLACFSLYFLRVRFRDSRTILYTFAFSSVQARISVCASRAQKNLPALTRPRAFSASWWHAGISHSSLHRALTVLNTTASPAVAAPLSASICQVYDRVRIVFIITPFFSLDFPY